MFFFLQAEDGIRDGHVTGVQTCALPIWESVQESFVLLYPEGMVKLNHSASEILKRCDGTMTIKEIITDIEKEFDTTGLTPDIIEFIHHAILRGWLITK